MDDIKASGRALLINIILLGMLAVGLAVWFEANRIHQQQAAITLEQGTVFPKAMTLKAFKLVGDDNQAFTNENLKGQWSLLCFGFTNCQMICPTTLTELNKAYRILEKADARHLPKVIFISVDPDRDSPARIKKYVISFNKNFIGATGNQENLEQLTKSLGIMYAKAQKSGEANYQVNHSGVILVINPEGEWAGILTPPYEAKIIAKDFMKMRKRG